MEINIISQMSWDYRVIKHAEYDKEKDAVIERYSINVVYFDEKNKPCSFDEPENTAIEFSQDLSCVKRDYKKEMKWKIEKFLEALEKPVLNIYDIRCVTKHGK